MNDSQKKVLGVIGGLGPIATAHFMELVIRMTDAAADQEHLNMIIYSYPSIPDRTGYILDHTQPSPLEPMVKIGKTLGQQGADFIAIPCLTAHYFYSTLEQDIPVPIINGIEDTVKHLQENGIRRVGIMATDGTVSTGLFNRVLEDHGMTPILPSAARQKDVMSLIYENIKANLPPNMDKFHAVRKQLQEAGAQAIILGCTELSLIKRDYPIGAGFIDAMEVLAQQSVLRCGGKLKDEYRCLITK